MPTATPSAALHVIQPISDIASSPNVVIFNSRFLTPLFLKEGTAFFGTKKSRGDNYSKKVG